MKTSSAPLITPVLVAGCIIIMVSFAIRASFGVFQIPIAEEFGWLRTEFSLAIAIQNLAWGIGQPIFGAIAEKLTDRKAIILGALTYAVGLLLSSQAITPLGHQAYAWLVGFGIAGTGFGVILAVVGRAASDENRSMALAIATAAGSAGQIFGAPVAEALLTIMSWQMVLYRLCGSNYQHALVPTFDEHGRARQQSRVGRVDGPNPNKGLQRPVLFAHLPWVLFLRLSASLHHRALPRNDYRNVRPHFGGRRPA